MSGFIIQGWCPGALRPMMSGDGLVVRVRPPGGRLTPEQAAGISALARAHGNGLVDLSLRANLQLRGVTPETHPRLIEGLDRLGLIDASPEAEARRNIVVTPFWADGDGAQDIAADLTRRLAADNAPALPGKFGFAVDTGPLSVLRATPADIRIERADHGLVVRADGAASGAPATPASAAAIALDLAQWFVASGGVTGGRGRMGAHLARGHRPPAPFDAAAMPAVEAAPPGPGLAAGGALVGLALGQMQAETLARLAALGPLRLTPWRMLLIEGATALPAIPGLITDPADPLRRVVACTGAPGCPQAQAPTRDLARRLAPEVPAGQVLHVSGCAKGCAHPGPAAITLTATPAGFDLIHGGTAADPPIRRGLDPATLAIGP